MLITGAGGMAKELFEALHQSGYAGEIFFYDDVSPDPPQYIYNSRVLRNMIEAEAVFAHNNNFVLGLGNPLLRDQMAKKFITINGVLQTLISPLATVGKFGNNIAAGCNIMTGVVITNDVTIGTGTLINVNASVSHDCIIGNFVEISPGTVITGNCQIGDYSSIGTNATILPGIKIGRNVVVGAGSVVTRDIADSMTVAGVPAKSLR